MMKELDYFGLEAAVFGVGPWTDDAAFRPGPVMVSARTNGAAVAAGGYVFVVGQASAEASTPRNLALRSTAVLDAQTMTFTDAPLFMRRYGAAVVQLDADRVLVVGGFGGSTLNTTEILHLSSNTVAPGPSMISSRLACAAVALGGGRILVVGGCGDDRDQLSSTEILSLDTMAFVPGPDMATPRGGCAAVSLDEHRVMVVGGQPNSGSLVEMIRSFATTEVLDVRTMAFTLGPSMGSRRSGCAAVAVDARHVLVVGGHDLLHGDALALTELLDLANMEFSPGPTMQTARGGCAATRLDFAAGPRILVIGGVARHIMHSTTEVLAFDQSDARPTRRRL